MFFDFDGGREELQHQLNATSSAEAGIRDLGVGQREPISLWSVPSIDAKIPELLERERPGARLVAQASLAFHRMGLRLPNEPFTTLDNALRAQFLNLPCLKALEASKQLPLTIAVEHCDETEVGPQLRIRGLPDQGLPVFSLKRDVERMNAEVPGLGWRLTDALSECHRLGLRTFEPSYIGMMADYQFFYDAKNDRDQALYALGEDEVTDAQIAEFLDECFCTVSRFADYFGGHRHLVGLMEGPAPRAPKRISKDAQISRESQAILKAIQRFLNHGQASAKALAGFRSERFETSPYDVGALAFVVWDKYDLVGEIVEHFERDAYEGGDSEEVLFEYELNLKEPGTWPAFLEGYKSLMAAYAAYCDLLALLQQEA